MAQLQSSLHSASTARSEQRHRLMILAGGALVLMAPLATSRGIDLCGLCLIGAAGAFVVQLCVGAGLDLYEWFALATVSGSALVASAAESHAWAEEDIRLEAAAMKEFDEELLTRERQARQASSRADTKHADTKRLINGRLAWGTLSFHLLFIVGVLLLFLAILPSLNLAGTRLPSA